MMDQQPICLPCYVGEHEYMICIRDIWKVQQFDNKREILSVRTANGEYLSSLRGSLDSALKLLCQFGFEDVNGSALVNIQQLIAYDPKESLAYFTKDPKDCIDISRRNKRKVNHLPRPQSLP